MRVTYCLWHIDERSGELVNTFSTQEGALAVVRKALELRGEGYVKALVLSRQDDNGEEQIVAQGQALAELVLTQGVGRAQLP